jgi:hypothetical protein
MDKPRRSAKKRSISIPSSTKSKAGFAPLLSDQSPLLTFSSLLKLSLLDIDRSRSLFVTAVVSRLGRGKWKEISGKSENK